MSLATERLNWSIMNFQIQSLASLSNSPVPTMLEPSWNAVTKQFSGSRFSGAIYEILSRTISNCAANVIVWLIHFALMRLSGWGSTRSNTVRCERRNEKRGRTFLWEPWDVGDTVPTSTESASRIIQEEGVGRGTGHRCWRILSKTLLYIGENKWWWERAGCGSGVASRYMSQRHRIYTGMVSS
jgi:hypothetical protein